MSRRQEFDAALSDELQKFSGVLGALWSGAKNLVSPLLEGGAAAVGRAAATEGAETAGKSMMYNLGRAAAPVGQAAGALAQKFPKTTKALRWGAGQAVQGAAFSAAAAPFAQRPQVTRVLPYPVPGKSGDQTNGGA